MSTTPEQFNREEMRSGRLAWAHVEKLTRFWQAHHGILADGKCGNITRSTLVDEQPSKLALEVVAVVRAEYGHGESDGYNNSGEDIARYRRIEYTGERIRGAWCAWLASYCLDEACGGEGMGLGPQPTAKGLVRKLGKSKLGRFVDPATEPLLPGDFIAWDKPDPAPAYSGHVGIVVQASDERGRFRFADGNVGRYPAKVKERSGRIGTGWKIEAVARPL